MKTFYKIENEQLQIGSGEIIPESFIEYEVGKEPQELLDALSLEKQEQDLTKQIQEAKTYLSETSWIWEKYSRNVTVLGDLTNEEFKLKYADIITKQEEARLLINSLELHFENINGI